MDNTQEHARVTIIIETALETRVYIIHKAEIPVWSSSGIHDFVGADLQPLSTETTVISDLNSKAKFKLEGVMLPREKDRQFYKVMAIT